MRKIQILTLAGAIATLSAWGSSPKPNLVLSGQMTVRISILAFMAVKTRERQISTGLRPRVSVLPEVTRPLLCVRPRAIICIKAYGRL